MTTPPTAPGTDRTQVPMIFIVGNSRSGTTMLGRVLGRHSRVHTFGEMHFFEQWVDGDTVLDRPEWPTERLGALAERLITSARDGFFDPVVPGRYAAEATALIDALARRDPVSLYTAVLAAEARAAGKAVPCEQTPRYLFFAGEILDAFPEARIVNMVRDPRDVLLSQKNKWRRRWLGASNIPLAEAARAWSNYHPAIIARLWVSAVRQARRFEDDPRFLTVRFEDLLADPEPVVRRICDFTALDFEADMLAVPQIGSSTGADRPDQRGISAAHAGSWRQNGQGGDGKNKSGLGSGELAFCETIAGAEMDRMGYARAGGNRLAMVPGAVTLAFKIALAVPLNLSRTRNLGDTLRRRFGLTRPRARTGTGES